MLLNSLFYIEISPYQTRNASLLPKLRTLLLAKSVSCNPILMPLIHHRGFSQEKDFYHHITSRKGSILYIVVNVWGLTLISSHLSMVHLEKPWCSYHDFDYGILLLLGYHAAYFGSGLFLLAAEEDPRWVRTYVLRHWKLFP